MIFRTEISLIISSQEYCLEKLLHAPHGLQAADMANRKIIAPFIRDRAQKFNGWTETSLHAF